MSSLPFPGKIGRVRSLLLALHVGVSTKKGFGVPTIYTQQVQELLNNVAELDGQNLPQAVAAIP